MPTPDIELQRQLALPALIALVREELKTRRGEPREGGLPEDILPSRKALKNTCDEIEPFLEPYDATIHARNGLLILGALYTLQDVEPSFLSTGLMRLRNICNNLANLIDTK